MTTKFFRIKCEVFRYTSNLSNPDYEKNKKEERKIFRILSLDGGGMRALVTIPILQELEKEFQDVHREMGDPAASSIRLHDMFDLIVGTSTGGILASMIGLFHFPVETLRAEYEDFCKRIFDHYSLYPRGMVDNRHPIWRLWKADRRG